MLSISYLSSASYPYTDSDLATLLMVSRANNLRDGLTGILLYSGGQILQLLEGPEDTVRERYSVIERDPRHRLVEKLSEEEVDERMFPAWTMGYRVVSDALIRTLPGFTEFLENGASGLGLAAGATRERWLLEWFRANVVAPA